MGVSNLSLHCHTVILALHLQQYLREKYRKIMKNITWALETPLIAAPPKQSALVLDLFTWHDRMWGREGHNLGNGIQDDPRK